MSTDTFRALVVSEAGEKEFKREITERTKDDLPEGEVLVKVQFSSLNYKDALSASGNRGVTRKYPHTPGVDAAGLVEDSTSMNFSRGDKVIVHGYDLGMDTAGGFGQYIRVPADWVVTLPDTLTTKEAMMFGTAGFTAAQSVLRLTENKINPGSGKILVTGATGGVGSMAVAILAKAGFEVVASTGKADQEKFLKSIGANEVISREDATDTTGKLLLKGLWSGVVDTVGGDILATALKSTNQRGVVTTCGNVASHDLNVNVYPFILRGVTLIGIDSASCPMQRREKIWDMMATYWKLGNLEALTRTVTLEGLDNEIDKILSGGQVGRVVVDLWE